MRATARNVLFGVFYSTAQNVVGPVVGGDLFLVVPFLLPFVLFVGPGGIHGSFFPSSSESNPNGNSLFCSSMSNISISLRPI